MTADRGSRCYTARRSKKPSPAHKRRTLGFVDKSPHVIASEHAEDIRKFSPARMLGGQRMVDVKKMKIHWGAFHAESEAEEHCRTQSKAA